MIVEISEFIRRLKAARHEIQATRAEDLMKIVLDANANIEDRVINEGENADGLSFGVYSEGYKVYRTKNNLTASPFPSRNFKKTGAMWLSNKPRVIERSETRAVVLLSPSGKDPQGVDNRDKLKWNEERFGQIIELSRDESKIVRKATKERYLRIFRKHLHT